MPFSQVDPLVLTGTSGTFDLDFTTLSEAWVNYTPASSGSLVITATVPTGWLAAFTVYDDEDVEMQSEADGALGLVWTLDELMQIRVTPSDDEPFPSQIVTFEWTYADRASSPLVVTAQAEVLLTPGAMNVTISNGIPEDTVTFSLIGPSASADFQTITLDDTGQAEDVAVYLPGLAAGAYLLRTEGVESGSEDTDFDVLQDALSFENTDPRPAPTPPVTDLAQHWRFFDLRDPDITYTMERNPRSWTNVFPPNDVTHEKVTAPDGQAITWEAAKRPWRMEFTGYLDTEEEYDALAFWSALRRRFWLVDHRNRAWLVTFEQFDAQARIVPNVPWAHNYTVKTVMFMQGTMG